MSFRFSLEILSGGSPRVSNLVIHDGKLFGGLRFAWGDLSPFFRLSSHCSLLCSIQGNLKGPNFLQIWFLFNFAPAIKPQQKVVLNWIQAKQKEGIVHPDLLRDVALDLSLSIPMRWWFGSSPCVSGVIHLVFCSNLACSGAVLQSIQYPKFANNQTQPLCPCGPTNHSHAIPKSSNPPFSTLSNNLRYCHESHKTIQRPEQNNPKFEKINKDGTRKDSQQKHPKRDRRASWADGDVLWLRCSSCSSNAKKSALIVEGPEGAVFSPDSWKL